MLLEAFSSVEDAAAAAVAVVSLAPMSSYLGGWDNVVVELV